MTRPAEPLHYPQVTDLAALMARREVSPVEGPRVAAAQASFCPGNSSMNTFGRRNMASTRAPLGA